MLSRFLMELNTEEVKEKLEIPDFNDKQFLANLYSSIDKEVEYHMQQRRADENNHSSLIRTDQNLNAVSDMLGTEISEEQFLSHLQSSIDKEIHEQINHHENKSAEEEIDILQNEISQLVAVKSGICKKSEANYHSVRLAKKLVSHKNKLLSKSNFQGQNSDEDEWKGDETLTSSSDKNSKSEGSITIKKGSLKLQAEKSREKLRKLFNNPPMKLTKKVIQASTEPSELEVKKKLVKEQYERQSQQIRTRRSKIYKPGQLQDTSELVFTSRTSSQDYCESKEQMLFQTRFFQRREKELTEQFKWRNVTNPTNKKQMGVKVFEGFKPAQNDN